MTLKATRETQFDEEVRANLVRNYLAHLAHGLLGQTGMRLLNAPTFVPAYVFALSGSEIAVGAARAIQYLGMSLSPLFGATLIEHRRRVLPVGFVIGALMRVQILGLGLAGIFLPAPGPLVSTFFFLGLFGVFLGIQGVVFNVLVSKVVPVANRGLLMGLRNALSGITATVVAIYAGSALVETDAFGNGYAATFLVAFLLTSVGLAMLAFVREPESPEVRDAVRTGARMRELPALLRGDPDFTRYFLARALAVLGRMAVPFYYLTAQSQFQLTGADLGALTAAFVLAQSLGNLGWGLTADRVGFRVVFLAALAVWMLSGAVLFWVTSIIGLWAVFACLGLGLGGFQLAAQSLVLEFGARRDLPLRIAVANSASEWVATFGALLGGMLGAWVSYESVFVVAGVAQAIALSIVAFGVREPRGRTSD